MLVARVVFDLLFFSALIRFVHYSHDSPFLFSFCRPFFSLSPLTLPLILPLSWRPIPPCCAHRTFALFYRIVCFNYSFCVCARECVCNFFFRAPLICCECFSAFSVLFHVVGFHSLWEK